MTQPHRRPMALEPEPTLPPQDVLAEAEAPLYAPSPPSEVREPAVKFERIGDVLRRARAARGDDLQQIADYLYIKPNYLLALEESRYEELPADAYVIGFLRTYATFLGYDGKKAIDRYRGEMAGRRHKPTLVVPTPISQGRTPSTIILIAAAAAALLIYIVWYSLSTSDRAVVSAPPPLPPVAADMTAPASSTPPTVAATAASPPAPAGTPPASVPISAKLPPLKSAPEKAIAAALGPQPLSIHADQVSWILVTDGKGQTIFDKVMKPGDTYVVPETPGLTLTTGNIGGITFSQNGVDLPRLTDSHSRVVRDLKLDGLRAKAAMP